MLCGVIMVIWVINKMWGNYNNLVLYGRSFTSASGVDMGLRRHACERGNTYDMGGTVGQLYMYDTGVSCHVKPVIREIRVVNRSVLTP